MIHGNSISHGHELFRWQSLSALRCAVKHARVTLTRVGGESVESERQWERGGDVVRDITYPQP